LNYFEDFFTLAVCNQSHLRHWIESTPAPRPSNAELVNAESVLVARARKCQKVRRHGRPGVGSRGAERGGGQRAGETVAETVAVAETAVSFVWVEGRIRRESTG
jgi:hypothetical protein